LPMRVLKHSTWMNPLALQPENALIQTNFSSRTRDSILVAARLPMFKVQARSSLPIHTIQLYKMKTPGCLVLGSLEVKM